MMPAMSRDVTEWSSTSGGTPVRRRGRRRRLLAIVSLVFAAGIGLGAVLGSWLASPDMPTAQVALEFRDAPYEVATRAYRPPVRTGRPAEPAEPAVESVTEPATEPAQPVATRAPRPDTPIVRPDVVAEVETQPIKPAVARPQAEAPQKKAPQIAIAPSVRTRKTPTWLIHAAAAPAAKGRPMIALVIDDLGLSQARVRRTMALPGPITLAFLPYGHNLKKLAKEGRAGGHELIIHMNMEPKDHDVDPGPKALLTSLDKGEIRARLDWAFDQFDGYIGISNHMGSRFTEWPEGMEIVVQALKRRGLIYFDSVTSTKSVGPALARAHGAAYASRDIFLDHDRTTKAVTRQLVKTERIARRRGYAIAIGHPHDVTLDVLEKWIPDAVSRGFVLVPLSAIVRLRLGEG